MSDIETREDAIKALHDIKAEQKRLADNDRELREDVVAKMAADIAAVQQKIAETSAPKVEPVSEKEATLRGFIRDDGSLDVDGICTDSTDRGEWHAEFKRLVDDRNLCRLMTKSGHGSSDLDQKLSNHITKAPAFIRRVFSDASSIGADFVPDLHLPELARKMYVPNAVEAALPSMQISTKEIRIPFSSRSVAPYLKSAATWSSITATDPATSSISVTAKSIGARITADEDTAADSLVPALDFFREELRASLADAVEDNLLNANTDATHGDINTTGSPRLWDGDGRWDTSDVASTAADHRRAWIGWRGASGDKGTDRDASAMTYADVLATRSTLGGGYQAGSDLLLVVSPYVMTKIMGFTQTATIDAFGSLASVAAGSIAKLAGMDVIVSGFMTQDLNASGVFDGVTETKTGYVIVHKPSWRMANYKPATVDIDRTITNGTIEIVGTRRCALVDMSGTGKSVAYGYNVATS